MRAGKGKKYVVKVLLKDGKIECFSTEGHIGQFIKFLKTEIVPNVYETKVDHVIERWIENI